MRSRPLGELRLGSRRRFVTWRRFGERELIAWRRRRDGSEHGFVLWPMRVRPRD